MYPGVANRTFVNRTPIERQSFDCLRLGSVMELIELTPKFCQSNTATIEHKNSFIWFQRRCCVQISCMYWLQFQTRVRKNSKDVTEGAKREMNNSGNDG